MNLCREPHRRDDAGRLGRVQWFEGNLADYEEDKKRQLGIDSVIPHRLKYKKFSR
jgi:hypothetical protein